jgi:4'-phosphopantetheinyl transferase
MDISPTSIERLYGTLSSDERERSERFHFARDRRRFIAARGALRSILGNYLDVEPSHVQLRYGPQGKPHLGGAFRRSDYRFNVSHSRDLALVAATRNREIGVDIEYMRSGVLDGSVAEQYFSPVEIQEFRALPSAKRLRAFYTFWTRKEAYIKGRGSGLSIPLDSFSVSLGLRVAPALLDVRDAPGESERWRLISLETGLEYAASMAVEGYDWRLKCWQWNSG